MTYETVEASVRGGEPVELYRFVLGQTVYTYTSTEEEVEFGDETYLPTTISRSSINQNDEINRSGVTITVPRDLDIADLYRVYAPAGILAVTVFRLHPTEDVYATVWAGRVLSCAWESVKAKLECESIFSSKKRMGLWRNYQATCPHVLFDSGCRLNRFDYRVSGAIGAVNSGSLNISAAGGFADGYFAGGFVQIPTAEGLYDTRFITSHTGAVVDIPYPFAGAEVGVAVDLYPGCKHTTEDCDTRYSNILNYGGFPFIPPKSPFGGTLVF
ncbi:MAG: hypothetical protein DRJ61_05200 [Acidobacteria bacterium]|nr:MAG: hypothetical protein DRJ61_05200 [Acidobacteriota bacterium]